MSRAPWLGRPSGRHAAPARGRNKAADGRPALPEDALPPAPLPEDALSEAVPPDEPPWAAAPAPTELFGAPTMADAHNAPLAAPLVSPVTDAARAAVAESAAVLPRHVPAGMAPVITVDALGRKCPLPIIMLAQQIGDVPVGSVIAVLADDPAAYTDIPAWCGLKSHDCVFRVDHASGWSFGILRRY